MQPRRCSSGCKGDLSTCTHSSELSLHALCTPDLPTLKPHTHGCEGSACSGGASAVGAGDLANLCVYNGRCASATGAAHQPRRPEAEPGGKPRRRACCIIRQSAHTSVALDKHHGPLTGVRVDANVGEGEEDVALLAIRAHWGVAEPGLDTCARGRWSGVGVGSGWVRRGASAQARATQGAA